MDKTGKYNWKFCTIGGVTRVNIENGQDIAHLGELDQKLWTALSCPVTGLEFDSKTLEYLDTNKDGRIHVNEVVAAAQWLTASVKDPDVLTKGGVEISKDILNPETEEGKALLEGIANTFKTAGIEDKDSITPADTAAALEVYAKAAAEAKAADEKALPYGADTGAVMDLVTKLKAKIDDWFLRSRLAAFDTESTAALDVSAERIGTISAKELPSCIEEIASYPLARINGSTDLNLNAAINPAWAADFAQLKALAIDKDYPGAESFKEADWQAIQAKLTAYTAWKEETQKEADSFLESQNAEAETVKGVDKFICLYNNFFKFLKNFVTFSDFYSRKEDTLADFQAGKLYIDQRCCELCIKVSDMSKHGDMPAKSGMFLVYCNCVSKLKPAPITIAAMISVGDTRSIHEGQNGIFYDRDGLDWDATIIKIVDNPISIREAFWSPYRKFAKWCTDKISKSAADKEAKATADLTAKADGVSIPADGAAAAEARKPAFDIAKFAGIFAAIGMALGFILDAVVGLLDSIIKMPWWGFFVLIAAIILLISGPSMFIAWSKLRKRNLGPVLNANGWAVNSRVLVNTKFGSTLTNVARYPKVKGKDPFADKTPCWKKLLRWIIILGAVFAALYFTDCLKCVGLPFHKEEAAVEEVTAIEEPAQPAADGAVIEPEAGATATE